MMAVAFNISLTDYKKQLVQHEKFEKMEAVEASIAILTIRLDELSARMDEIQQEQSRMKRDYCHTKQKERSFYDWWIK